MTKQVEGVSEKIIACAKEEFLQKGYSDASLRTIAEKAGTTTGSIYSRFKDKGRIIFRDCGTGGGSSGADVFTYAGDISRA